MDTINPAPQDGADAPRPETDAEKQRRLACEARMLAEARAQLDAGCYVDATDVDAWIDSLDTDNELPPPPIRRR